MKEGIAALMLATFGGGLGAVYNPNPMENPWWLLYILATTIAVARIVYHRRKATQTTLPQSQDRKSQSD